MCDIDAIVHVEITLSLHWDEEIVVNHIKKDVRGAYVWDCDSKVINLAFKKDSFVVNDARVEARLVCSRGQAYIP